MEKLIIDVKVSKSRFKYY